MKAPSPEIAGLCRFDPSAPSLRSETFYCGHELSKLDRHCTLFGGISRSFLSKLRFEGRHCASATRRKLLLFDAHQL